VPHECRVGSGTQRRRRRAFGARRSTRIGVIHCDIKPQNCSWGATAVKWPTSGGRADRALRSIDSMPSRTPITAPRSERTATSPGRICTRSVRAVHVAAWLPLSAPRAGRAVAQKLAGHAISRARLGFAGLAQLIRSFSIPSLARGRFAAECARAFPAYRLRGGGLPPGSSVTPSRCAPLLRASSVRAAASLARSRVGGRTAITRSTEFERATALLSLRELFGGARAEVERLERRSPA